MRLHLIDGTFELFRAHYAPRPGRTAPNGQDVKATVGVAASLLRLMDDPDERATHLAVAFDNPVESFRNRLFGRLQDGGGYGPRAGRAVRPRRGDRGGARHRRVVDGTSTKPTDALATAARRWRDEVEQVRILTPDKDLGQCVVGTRVVQVDRIRRRVIDEDGVRDRNGVAPASIPDWLALVGDTADGIPGIRGFGAKTAAALLSHYGTVEAIPADPTAWAIRGAREPHGWPPP